MGLESATYLSGLVATNPVGASDPKSQGDDHLRLIKSVLLATFPNMAAAVTATPADLNLLTGLAATGGIPGQPITGYKSADQDFTSNTALADITGLTIALVANTAYRYRLFLFLNALTSTAAGFKTALAFTGSRDIHLGRLEGLGNSAGTSAGQLAGTSIETGQTFSANSANTINLYYIEGVLHTTSSGNLKLQGCQSVSNVNASRFCAGSYLYAEKIG